MIFIIGYFNEMYAYDCFNIMVYDCSDSVV